MVNANSMSEEQVLEKFREIVAKSLRIDPTTVNPECTLDELGAESLDLIEITMETEAQFNIWLPEKSIFATAEEVFGHDTLQANGLLTNAGKNLFRRRLPGVEQSLLEGDVTTQALQKYFLKVGTWVRMVYDLAQHTPSSCAECNGELVPAMGFRMKCKACGKELSLRSGEELNREWVERYHREEYLAANSQETANA